MTPASAASAPATAVAPVAEDVPPASAPPPEPEPVDRNDLLASLVTAMREVAEHERESSLFSLRGLVDESVETLRQRGAVGADELRQRAEVDISGIGEWVKVETERIAAEGDRKIEGRRQQLTQQLTDHEQGSQREIESLHARVDEYERELASFFAQLNEIDDPAAFGTAAKRMPRAPTLTGQAVAPPAATGTSPAATSPAAAAPEASAAPAPEASAAPAPEPTAEPPLDTPAEPSAAQSEAELAENHRTRLDALGLTRDDTAPSPEALPSEAGAPDQGEPAVSSDQAAGSASQHDPLRARLAELDASIGPEQGAEPATATTQGHGGEVATAIVVHGLGSFGAITSFKQVLERVDGVHGISLALGPTGEFVYRASHDTGFDLVAAIEQIERGGAQIERQADGSLRVTVQRTR